MVKRQAIDPQTGKLHRRENSTKLKTGQRRSKSKRRIEEDEKNEMTGEKTEIRDVIVESAEYAAKYRMYARDYLRRINHRYFSGKNLAGTGRVFDSVTTVEGFVVKESRDPPIKRFLETPNFQEEQTSKSGGTPAAKRQMSRKS